MYLARFVLQQKGNTRVVLDYYCCYFVLILQQYSEVQVSYENTSFIRIL